MNDAFLKLIERIIKSLVWIYRDAIDFYEEVDSEATNVFGIEAESQGLQAYEIY